MVRRSAGEDHHPPEVLDLRLREADVLELEPVPPHPLADRVGHGLRLLVDLLEHERLVALLLGVLVVPVDLHEAAVVRGLAVDREEAHAGGRDRDDLAVLDQLHAARLAQERGDRGGQEHLAVAVADDERALQAGADEHPRMRAVRNDEREMPFELDVGGTHSLDEVAGVVALDEVGDDLCVRLGGEVVPVGDE